MNKPISQSDIKNMGQKIGSENISVDMDNRILFSQDIWAVGETAAFIVSPTTTEELSEAVKLAAEKKIALNPRGAGISYTKGYIPSKPNTGVIDFSKMDKILEINTADMYVTVQAGCTWQALHKALKPLGFRTPFWGPVSGGTSTIGGGLSQNNAFFGASSYGSSIDSVTCLKVVLADGTILKTGSWGTKGAKPFLRQYGPDLTGLFLADAGALAYKAEITLRLIHDPRFEDWASFGFVDFESWAEAATEIGRLGIACELFGFDPELQDLRLQRESLFADVKSLSNVISKQKGGLLKGLKEGAKVALAGRNYMKGVNYSLHFIVEGYSDEEVASKMKLLQDIAKARGAKTLENSIPKVVRANPFGPLNTVVGPKGQRYAPIHGIVPMSDGMAATKEVDDFLRGMKSELSENGAMAAYFISTLSNNGFLIEPVFHWEEPIREIHRMAVEESVLKRVKTFEPNPGSKAAVLKARQGILDIFSKYGAAHLQIGRTYPYRKHREPETWALLEGIKTLVDPNRTVNNGSLGLSDSD